MCTCAAYWPPAPPPPQPISLDIPGYRRPRTTCRRKQLSVRLFLSQGNSQVWAMGPVLQGLDQEQRTQHHNTGDLLFYVFRFDECTWFSFIDTLPGACFYLMARDRPQLNQGWIQLMWPVSEPDEGDDPALRLRPSASETSVTDLMMMIHKPQWYLCFRLQSAAEISMIRDRTWPRVRLFLRRSRRAGTEFSSITAIESQRGTKASQSFQPF